MYNSFTYGDMYILWLGVSGLMVNSEVQKPFDDTSVLPEVQILPHTFYFSILYESMDMVTTCNFRSPKEQFLFLF